MKSIPTLHVPFRASRWAGALTLLLYLLALPMPWLANLPGWLAACLSLALLVLLMGSTRRWQQDRGGRLMLLADGNWLLEEHGQQLEYALGQGLHCTPWLTVLPLCGVDGRKRRLLLWPDSAAPDALRRLRVWLRWGVEQTANKTATAP